MGSRAGVSPAGVQRLSRRTVTTAIAGVADFQKELGGSTRRENMRFVKLGDSHLSGLRAGHVDFRPVLQ
jgi:hypothetical protein